MIIQVPSFGLGLVVVVVERLVVATLAIVVSSTCMNVPDAERERSTIRGVPVGSVIGAGHSLQAFGMPAAALHGRSSRR